MINYDEKMVLNGCLVIKMGIDQIGKNFVKAMSVKKFSYLGQFIRGLRRSAKTCIEKKDQINVNIQKCRSVSELRSRLKKLAIGQIVRLDLQVV